MTKKDNLVTNPDYHNMVVTHLLNEMKKGLENSIFWGNPEGETKVYTLGNDDNTDK